MHVEWGRTQLDRKGGRTDQLPRGFLKWRTGSTKLGDI